LFAMDYVNKRERRYGHDLRPALSNGVNNHVNIKFKNGVKSETSFLLFYSNEILKIKGFMIEYHLLGKVSFLGLINFLGISDYDKIQEFKKELKAYSDKTM